LFFGQFLEGRGIPNVGEAEVLGRAGGLEPTLALAAADIGQRPPPDGTWKTRWEAVGGQRLGVQAAFFPGRKASQEHVRPIGRSPTKAFNAASNWAGR
jgi:hypothetical protein